MGKRCALRPRPGCRCRYETRVAFSRSVVGSMAWQLTPGLRGYGAENPRIEPCSVDARRHWWLFSGRLAGPAGCSNSRSRRLERFRQITVRSPSVRPYTWIQTEYWLSQGCFSRGVARAYSWILRGAEGIWPSQYQRYRSNRLVPPVSGRVLVVRSWPD